MLALNRSDIEDIANGNHNRYIESQDKDKLLRELAYRLLKATPDTGDVNDKLDDTDKYVEETKDVLQSITQ